MHIVLISILLCTIQYYMDARIFETVSAIISLFTAILNVVAQEQLDVT